MVDPVGKIRMAEAHRAWVTAMDALAAVDIALGQVPGAADASDAFTKLARRFKDEGHRLLLEGGKAAV
jgi:hypothetical protein